MPRIRIMFGTMIGSLTLVMLMSVTMAQGPGRGGRGGPGGPGGFMGGPGGFGGVYGLLRNDAVLEDIKATDKQKDQLKQARDYLDKKQQAAFAAFRGNRGGRNNNQNGNQNGNGNVNPGGNVNGDPNGGFGGSRPNFEEMQAAREQMNAETDAVYAKILSKAQRERLNQIDLRRQGPTAVFRPDVAQKLNIGEDQMAQLQLVQQESRAARGQLFQGMRNMGNVVNFQEFRKPDGSFDRDAMKAKMEQPEVKAQMEKMRTEMEKKSQALQDQTEAAIAKVLTKKQKATFNKMLGKEFDVSKLGGPGFGRGPGGQRNGNAATDNTTKADEKAKDESKSDNSAKKKTTRKGTRKSAA